MRSLIWFVLRLRFLPSVLFRAWRHRWQARAEKHLMNLVRKGRAGI